MAFRYLIYRTDFGDTIVRESPSSSSTGGTEAELFTDFVIPEIQPLYLWRVTGGTDVVPNTDQNINDWLDHENPPGPDDYVTYDIFTGYTASTQIELDDKINIVTGATGNIGEFDVSGNLVDTGWQISGLTGGSGQDVYVSGMTYVGSTLTLQRTEGFSDLSVLISTSGTTDGVVSGATLNGQILELSRTEGLPDVTVNLSGLTSGIEDDILYISGITSGNTIAIAGNSADILYISGITSGNTIAIADNTSDITYISGITSGNTIAIADNTSDITYISGITDTKLDITVFDTYTGDTRTELDLTITGATNGLTKVGRDVELGGTLTKVTSIDGAGFDFTMFNVDSLFLSASATTYTDIGAWGGIRYSADYSTNYVDRSLVDKAYVDTLASGLDWKASVLVATTSSDVDLDLTGGTFGGTIDGITLVDGDRVLIKNQDSAQEENGIYDYSGGSNTFIRSSDFDGTPAGEVSTGAVTYTETGDTLAGTSWVLNTQDPITIDVTPLTFVLFSVAGGYIGGVGINIVGNTITFDGGAVAGTNLTWSGTQLNVTGVTTTSEFNSYTAATEIRLGDIEGDITYISGITSGNTEDIIYISGVTDQNTTDIATLSGNTITIDEFTGYTASTDIRITNIEGDIVTISGDVVQNTADILTISGDVIQNTIDIATISAETANKIDKVTGATGNLGEFTIDGNLIDTGYAISGLTGDTSSPANEIQLVSSGVTDLNTVLATEIDWHIADYSGTSFLWSGGSAIFIQESGDYELSYHLTLTQDGGGADKSVGTYIVLNNTETLDRTSSAGSTSGNDLTEGVTLPPTIFSFTAGDKLELVGFRIGGSGIVNTNAYETVILIKKKGTLV